MAFLLSWSEKMTNLLFWLILFAANVIQAITGFAGTVLAMPFSIILLGENEAKVILNLMALVSGIMIAVINRKHIRWTELLKISVFMTAGMLISLLIKQVITSDEFLIRIYGIVIIFIAVKNLIIRDQKKHSAVVLYAVLILAGILHGLFVSGGALLVVYAAQVLDDKDEFRATVSSVWIVLNTIIISGQIRDRTLMTADPLRTFVGIIILFAATWLGNRIGKHVSKKLFLKITYILLIISGLSISV